MAEKYHIVTYGCQMNVHESEKIAGILRRLGYEDTANKEDADIIVFNTCCIRENAENHAFGNIGALKKLKKQKPHLLIAVGGCMTQEEGKTEVLRKKFPFIDIMFGTLNLEVLGDLILRKKQQKKKVIEIREKEGEIVEFDDVIDDSLVFNMGVLSFHIMKGEKPEGIFFRTRYITSWHVMYELLESEET